MSTPNISTVPPATSSSSLLTATSLLPILLAVYATYTVLSSLHSVFLGPLSKFPGPKIRAFTQVPRLINLWTGNQIEVYTNLHTKYGPVVRIAPSALSYAGGIEAWKAVYGFKKPFEAHLPKDLLSYARPYNGVDSLLTGDDVTHARQRKLASHAFSDKSLKKLEPMLKEWCALMVRKLSEKAKAGDAIDMLKYYNCTTFDIMGDLSFNEGLHMLEEGEYSDWVKTIFGSIKEGTRVRAARMISTFANFLVVKTMQTFPQIRVKMTQHWKYTTERVDRRLAKTPERSDLWSKLLVKDSKDGGLSLQEQYTIANLFLVAGTETTATALSGTTYYLTQNPQYMAKLKDEIRSTYSSYEDLTLESVARLKYLHAVLQEGMRMYPPVPTHLFRKVPKGGAELCDQLVPEGTSVAVHQYATYRNPDLWTKPNEFRPERWLGDPEFKNDRLDALEPFSVGPRNCLGKSLAWHEMRLILATALLHFDMELLEESKNWPEQKVYSLWEKVPLMCKLKVVDPGA